MCGGCGGGSRDWASAAVAGPAARAVAAATAAALCRAVADPTRVAASAGGWLVSAPTGATTVAATLTALWAALPALAGRVAAVGMPRLDQLAGAPPARGPEPATGAVTPAGIPAVVPGAVPAVVPAAGAALAVQGAHGRPTGRRVAVLVGGACAPERSWADAVVRGDDPDAVVPGVDAAAPTARVLVHCGTDGEALAALAALAAPGPAQRSTTTAVVSRGRPGHPWADDLDSTDGPGGAGSLAVLDGAAPPAGRGAAGDVVRSCAAHPAAAACWGAAALAAGGVRGSRTRLVVDGGRVVVDLLDRTAVALRALP